MMERKGRISRRTGRRLVTLALLVAGLLLVLLRTSEADDSIGALFEDVQQPALHAHHHSRQLLAKLTLANCSPAAIENFPPPGLSPSQRRQGGVILHLLVAVYMFWGLALACDEFFVPACERLCEVLDLQSDVAGATFMAAGSSAPELATALIGVFIAEDDIALGAVVGSAVFNILFVIAFCAIFAGSVIHLHWFPMVRDCVFYAISILALVLSIYDGEFKWYEALVLVLLYVVYILFMCVNQRVENWIVPRSTCCGFKDMRSSNGVDEESRLDGSTSLKTTSYSELESEDSDDYEVNESRTLLSPTDDHESMQLRVPNGRKHSMEEDCESTMAQKLGDKEEEPHMLSMPDTCCKRVVWLLSLPLLLPQYVTTPDVRVQRWRNWWAASFTVSCAWIGLFSYVMVWMITIIGDTLNIPDTVMGITFIAAGASIPDVIASFLVLKDGYGDMAVSNAIGSNIFDILMCMGIPYLVRALLKDGSVEVFSHGLTYSSILLFSTVILFLVTMFLNGWRLTRAYGLLLLLFYLAITTIAILFELNVFGYVNPPVCPSHV